MSYTEPEGFPPAPTEIGLPADWLVVAPAESQRLYRVVNRNPPRLRDFESDRARGRPRFPEDLEADYLGLSMFYALDQALSMARRYPKFVAEIMLDPGQGFALARTMLDHAGHYTVWGEAESLLEQVTSIVAKGEE